MAARPNRKYTLTGLPIDGATVRRLAVEADADPRSIIAELWAELGEGDHLRGVARRRVRRVLARHGYIELGANTL